VNYSKTQLVRLHQTTIINQTTCIAFQKKPRLTLCIKFSSNTRARNAKGWTSSHPTPRSWGKNHMGLFQHICNILFNVILCCWTSSSLSSLHSVEILCNYQVEVIPGQLGHPSIWTGWRWHYAFVGSWKNVTCMCIRYLMCTSNLFCGWFLTHSWYVFFLPFGLKHVYFDQIKESLWHHSANDPDPDPEAGFFWFKPMFFFNLTVHQVWPARQWQLTQLMKLLAQIWIP